MTPSRRKNQVSITRKIASKLPIRNRVSGKMCLTVQKKSTPFKKPKNKGGSPKGVSDPPALETIKMKNTITCALCTRLSLARISGRSINMDAPVVPMKLASTAPMIKIPALSAGVPCRLPRIWMPPATVNSAVNKTMKGMYSASRAWTRLTPAAAPPKLTAKGIKNARAQAAEIFP